MSLLMEALKRAEARKDTAAPDALRLEPLANAGGKETTSLPDLAAHIDAVDADLAAAAAPRNAPGTAPLAAGATFVASPEGAASHQALWWTLGLLLLAGLGIGAYFAYRLHQLNSPPSVTAHSTAATVMPVYPAVPATEPLPPAPAPLPPVRKAEYSAPVPPTPPPLPRSTQTNTGEEATPTLRISRSKAQIDPALLRGWQQLRAGALETARSEYAVALRRDPKSSDALLGLAAIAQLQGHRDEAARLQGIAAEANPQDAAAQAVLLARQGESDPQGSESRLKNLLATQPESPELNFALGNLYARQQRWGEAQAAFFNATAGDADNPDYLFNLAVALDHLRQARPALQHYLQALKAAVGRPTTFDGDLARRRAAQLQENLQESPRP